MGDHQHGPCIFLEVVFQPFDRFRVEVVGRLVKQQDVGLLDQQAGEGDATLLAARQVANLPVSRRTTQRLHCDLELVIEGPAIDCVDLFLQFAHLGNQFVIVLGIRVGHGHRDFIEALDHVGRLARAVLDVLEHGLRGVELRLLRQVSDGDVLTWPSLALESRYRSRP